MQKLESVRHIMVKATQSIPEDMPVYDALDVLVAKKLAGVPVVSEDGRLVGFLTEKDCLRIQGISHQYNMTGAKVKDFMSDIKEALHPEMDLLGATSAFLACNFAVLPVVEDERLIGSISRQNMLKAIQKLHNVRGKGMRKDEAALKMVDNPASIDQMQALVGKSNRAQLATMFGGRHKKT